MAGIKDTFKIVSKSVDEIEKIKADVRKTGLPDETISIILYGLTLIIWLPKLLLEQKITLFRLKELLFGKSQKTKSKKRQNRDKNKANNITKDSNSKNPSVNVDEDKSSESESNKEETAKKKSGRIAQHQYNNAIEHKISHQDLAIGMDCPSSCGGKLYNFKPSIRVIIKGNQMGVAHRYIVEKLRCALCNEIFTPELPKELEGEKYDAHFIAQLAIQKYFMGVPSLRQQTYHKILDFPLPHSTQWMLNEKLASSLIPIFNQLCKLASNAPLIHVDDTSVKIVDEICSNRSNPDKKRKGMFTTGLLGIDGKHKIGLFFSGLQHAGENLNDILSKRQSDDVVKVMSDALSRNTSKVTNIIKCYCLSHSYRKFDELISFYEKPCLKITDFFSSIYKIEHQTKNMTDDERLSHHQKYSQSILNDLHSYLNKLMDEKEVEPNDSLGKAIAYTLKHWHELTQFVRIKGVPLDNNELERSLKVAIRGRNNWMFYKTTYGAYIGSVLTSVIYTCTLSNVNPLDYLIAVQKNKNQIVKEPSAWLPWNYQTQLNNMKHLAA